MSFRITFVEAGVKSLSKDIFSNGVVKAQKLISSSGKIELREDDGAIVRLGANTDFILFDSPLGLRPEYGRGEVYLGKKGSCGKYRTSCYMAAANQLSERPDVFIRPSSDNNIDEFYAVNGDIIIYEFDENMRTFTICTLREGEKALITFDDQAKKIIDRYSASISAISDDEYNYILNEYVDRRKWV